MQYKNLLITFFLLCLIGCSATEEFYDDITSPDYVNSSKAKSLEIPPDLSEIEENKAYDVPGKAKSYKEFLDSEENLKNSYENPKKLKVIENPDGLRIVKSGNLRWLVAEKSPDVIWPHVKEFWEDLGFRVTIANKRTGIIETEWMDTDDIKLDQDRGALSTFDKWLDSLSGFADRRKFRTRVEYGDDGATEIYISQRSAEAAADQHSRILRERSADYNVGTIYQIEEYQSDEKSGNKKIKVSEQRELDDYEIDSELLTRLMIKLGATNFDAKEKVNNPEVIVKAELINKQDDLYIKMYDPYERAWRRLGLALDIIGFVTEDKDRSKGIYYVRFSETELPSEKNEEEEGLLDSLIFWDHDKKSEDELKAKEENKAQENIDQLDNNPNEPNFTGIDAPEIKPIGDDIIDENIEQNDWKQGEEETWFTKLWPSWGDDDNFLPSNEKRYRIRIKPSENGTSLVYIDYSNEKRSISAEAKKVLSIINEYLK